MKRLIAVAVVLAALLVPSIASAHTLSVTRAEDRGGIEARRFITPGDDYWYTDCVGGRRSAHSFRCIIATYDSSVDVTCDAYVNVRFVNSRSYRTTAGSRYEIDCRSGDSYNVVERY